MLSIETKAAIVRGIWYTATFPLIIYLELREKFDRKKRRR